MFLRRLLTNKYRGAHFSSLNANINNKYHTPFHAVINTSTNVDEVLKFMRSQPVNTLAEMAKTTNDQGELPIDLFFSNTHFPNDPCVSMLYDNMIHVTQNHTIQDVTKSISIDDIANSGYSISNLSAGLYDNLLTGISIVNDVRAVVDTSASHPCINSLSKKEKGEIHSRLKNLRNWYDNSEDPEVIFEACKTFKMGNCHELSFAAIHFLKEKAKSDLSAHVIQIKNGDHTFVIFGSKGEDKLENVVYVDVWTGEVGIASFEHLMTNIGTFRRFYDSDDSFINIIAKLNPNYHSFYVREDFEIQKVQNSVSTLGLFQKNNTTIEPPLALTNPDSSNKPFGVSR